MTLNKIILLCCLHVLAAASVVLAASEATLIVGPGETLSLQAPEAGAGLEAALDGGPLTPIGPTLTAPAAGDHWLAVASRDRAGNLSPIDWIRLRIDSDPPDVELRTEPAPVTRNRLWMPPRAMVTASARDDLAGIAGLFVAVGDEVHEFQQLDASVELPPAGEANLRAWAVDHTGNRSVDSMLDLTIDATPPQVEIRLGCPPASEAAHPVVAPDCRIDVEVSDRESGGAKWTPRIDGRVAQPGELGGPWIAGDHAIEVVAVDAVGNDIGVGPFRFTVDDTGPEIVWRVSSEGVEGAAGEIFYRPPVTVVAEAVDTPAGLEHLSASIGGEDYQPIDGPVEVEGDRLRLRAVDRVGNASAAEASWRLDLEPPEIHLETGDEEAIHPGATVEVERGAAIRFRATDRGAGVETSTYSLSVESAHIVRRWWWWPPHEQPLPEQLVFPWAGRFNLSVEAADRLGNRSTAQWHVVVRSQRGGS